MSQTATFSLRHALKVRYNVASRREVTTWFRSPAPLWVDDALLSQRLLHWRSTRSPAARQERQPVIAALEHAAATSGRLSYNAVWRKRQGGRRYLYAVPGYRGPLVLTAQQHRALPHPRALLQSIPSTVRPAIFPDVGHHWVVADIDRCFLAIAAALTRDPQLLADLSGDVHQRVGDALGGHLAPDQRRGFGKLVNNALVGGITPYGLQPLLLQAGLPGSARDAERVYRGWWTRYGVYGGALHRLRERLWSLVQRRERLVVVAPDGRRFSFSAAEVSGRLVPAPSAEVAFNRATRSIISSLWRAVEGSILDRTLHHLQGIRGRAGLRLALSMYDGLLLSVPSSRADHGVRVVASAMRAALRDTGVHAGVSVTHRPAWGTP